MTFDKRWIQFEAKHGPQSPGAKEDALFWYRGGQIDVPDVATQKEDAEPATPAELDESYNEGQAHVIGLVRDFANANVPDDPLTKENLLQFLETLR